MRRDGHPRHLQFCPSSIEELSSSFALCQLKRVSVRSQALGRGYKRSRASHGAMQNTRCVEDSSRVRDAPNYRRETTGLHQDIRHRLGAEGSNHEAFRCCFCSLYSWLSWVISALASWYLIVSGCSGSGFPRCWHNLRILANC